MRFNHLKVKTILLFIIISIVSENVKAEEVKTQEIESTCFIIKDTLTTLQIDTLVEVDFDDLFEEEEEEIIEEDIYFVCEEAAIFLGGDEKLFTYIGENLNLSVADIEKASSNYVTLSFVVRKTGEINNVKVVLGAGEKVDEEFLRVMQESPKWIAGKQRGKAVNSFVEKTFYFK